ncbi:hypothetical protein JADG_010468, partial [Aureobasidium aubasidani]
MRTEYCLVALEPVPKSQAIKRLRCSGGGVCSPALFISIASALPALQGIVFDINDSCYPLQRCKNRYADFAKQLSSLATSSSTLQDVELKFIYTDHLSLSLQELVRTCKIKSLTLDDIALTLQLFQSHQTLNYVIPWWHTLTHIDITFSSIAADGGWFFDGHPEIPINLDTEVERNDLGPRRQRVHQMFASQEALARAYDFEQDLGPENE